MALTTREKKKLTKKLNSFDKRFEKVQILGATIFLFAVTHDIIAYLLTWQFNPWYGWKQLAMILFGIALFWVGRK